MKLLRVASLILVVFASYAITNELKNSNSKTGADTVESQWKQFKIDFKRNYTTAEDATRFELFKDTLVQIDEHNKKYELGKVDVPATLNEYSDWTDEEKMKLLGSPISK